MKRFSEQFKKKSETIRMRANERADLRDRLVSYMEYHPLPADMRTTSMSTKKGVKGIPSEAFRIISIHKHYLQGFAGVFAVFLIVGIPLIAERAVPGDMLYAVKTNISEEVRATLTLSPYAKVEWETQRLERRVAEARLLAREGKLTAETEAKVAMAVKAHSDAAQLEIAQMREGDADEAAIAEIAFASALEVQSEVLEGHIALATKATGSEAGEGSSVVALASVVHQAAGIAQVAQGQAGLSYEKLRGRVETESTYAYELFASVHKHASAAEVLDIERRLADVERKVAAADTAHSQVLPQEAVVEEITEVVSEDSAAPTQELQDEALEQEETVPTAESQTVDAQAQTAVREETAAVAPMKEVVDVVSVLRAALKDLQKINAFMTDIDVRQNVTMEELVPVVPTDDERYAAINVSYAQVKADHQLIAYAVTSGLANEKIQLGYKTLQTMVQNIDAALSLGNISQAESLTKEALLLSSDMRTLLGDIELPAEPEVTEGKATTTSATTEEVMRG